MTKTNGNEKTAEILPNEVIRHIPLTDIFFDYDYNVRSKAEVLSDVSDAVQDTTVKSEHQGEGTGLRGLCLDLHNSGQDTPIVVRKVEDGKTLGGKKTDKPFEAICGFRRGTAAMLLNEGKAEGFGKGDSKEAKELAESIAKAKKEKRSVIPNTADGTILAVVRTLTPREARILNVRENTNRQNLTTQDLVKSVVALQGTEKMNQVQIADALGIGQPYVSRLIKIGGLPKAILAHWRGEAKLPGLPEAVTERLTSRQMTELFDATKGQTDAEITARYIELLSPPAPEEGGGEGTDPVLKKIKDAAELLAGMVRNGIVTVEKLDWARVIGPKKDGYLIGTPKIDAIKRGEYWDLMDKEFTRALNPEKQEKKTQKEKDDAAAN